MNNKEKIKANKKALYNKKLALGVCTRCTDKSLSGLKLCQYHKDYAEYYNNKQTAERRRVWSKNTRIRAKQRVLDHYGARCACCENTTVEFLTIDHVKGDGAKFRKGGKRSGSSLWLSVVREKFPDHYRLLCANCNLAMGVYGKCPHNKLPEQVTRHPANPLNPVNYKKGYSKPKPFTKRSRKPGRLPYKSVTNLS